MSFSREKLYKKKKKKAANLDNPTLKQDWRLFENPDDT